MTLSRLTLLISSDLARFVLFFRVLGVFNADLELFRELNQSNSPHFDVLFLLHHVFFCYAVFEIFVFYCWNVDKWILHCLIKVTNTYFISLSY